MFKGVQQVQVPDTVAKKKANHTLTLAGCKCCLLTVVVKYCAVNFDNFEFQI